MEVGAGDGSSTIGLAKKSLASERKNDKTHVHRAIPVLSSRVFHKPSRSFNRSQSTPFRQDQLLELRTKMRSPSVGGVDDCSCTHFSTISADTDPAVAVFLRDAQDRSICLKVQVALFEELLQKCVDELVCPSVEQIELVRYSTV